MVANEASGQNMGADMKPVVHYYLKGSLFHGELGNEEVIQYFLTYGNSGAFDGGCVLDASF